MSKRRKRTNGNGTENTSRNVRPKHRVTNDVRPATKNNKEKWETGQGKKKTGRGLNKGTENSDSGKLAPLPEKKMKKKGQIMLKRAERGNTKPGT